MRAEKDFEELLRLFNKYKVRYCVIGAFAVGFYAKPRYTKDMDIFVEPGIENGERIVSALKEFGFGTLALSTEDFSKKGKIVQLGYDPVRVDIVTSISGCSFNQTWKNKKAASYGRQKIFFIGINDLIKNKKASDRKQDKADLEILLAARNKP